MACDPNTLLNEARCYSCLTEDQRAAIITSLLCQLASGGGTPPAPPSTQLFIETFDTHPGFDLTGWTLALGGGGTNNVIDPDYVAQVLEGTESLRTTNLDISNHFIHRNVTPVSKIEVFFKLQVLTLVVPEPTEFVHARGADLAVRAGAGMDTSTMQFFVHVLGAGVNTAAAFALNTTYNCWFSYQKNNGANRIATFAFSAGTTRPTSGANFAQAIGAIAADDIANVAVGIVGSDFLDTEDIVMDRTIADSNHIGDNP